MLAIALETEYTFPLADKVKDAMNNASSAPVAAAAASPAAAAAKAKEPEPEEEEEEVRTPLR